MKKARGVSEEDARRSLVPSGTTLLWLLQHVCYAERLWVRNRFAGESAPVRKDVVSSATLAEAIATYEAEWSLVDAIVAWGDADTVARRIVAHLDAGADHVGIQVLSDEPFPLGDLAALAGRLL